MDERTEKIEMVVKGLSYKNIVHEVKYDKLKEELEASH